VQVWRGGIAAVPEMSKYVAAMHVLARADALASGTEVRIVCKHTWRDLQHDEVAVEPTRGQVVRLWMGRKRLTVWLTIRASRTTPSATARTSVS
jgi:hypothetical protein